MPKTSFALITVWTYSNEGGLECVPGEEAAYYGALDRAYFSLVEARVETYAGIVFANWDAGAPSLEEYLGNARWCLDVAFNRLDRGTEAIGPVKWIEPLNWKTQWITVPIITTCPPAICPPSWSKNAASVYRT